MADIEVKVDDKTIIASKENVITAVSPEIETEAEVDDIILPEDVDLDNLSPEEYEKLRHEWIETNFPLPTDFPSESDIKAIQERYGKVRVRRIAPGEAYVLRRMSRTEFKNFLKAVEKFSDDPIENRLYQEELMVEICTVWPHVTVADIRGESEKYSAISSAGTASVLAADIQEISNMSIEAIGPIEEL